jgi:hypothetical protein
MNKISDSWQTRFWSKVNKTSNCWLWSGETTRGGYGKFTITVGHKVYQQYRVHRLSYYLKFGVFDTTLCVLHTCDTRLCINPEHLFLGTRKDNWEDAKIKNRISRGSKHNISVLNEDEVRLIKDLNLSWGIIAKCFGVHKSTIQNIKQRKTWRHV